MKTRIDNTLMRAAKRHLRRRHKTLATLIREFPDCPLDKGRSDLFDTLTWSIVGQQLSVKAARTIGLRLLALTNERRMMAAKIARIDHDTLRGAGLSNAKARYVSSLAKAVNKGQLNFRSLAQQSDDKVIQQLVTLPGVGVWTAQMFLMFALRRPDVAAPGDLGLQRGMQMLFDLDERPDADTFIELAEPWRPYRSIASWYLWRLAG